MTATLWSSSTVEMLTEPSDAMNAQLVVVPWSHFGTHRLYVHTADGRLVGWVDEKTGHRSLAMPEFASAFKVAVPGTEDAPTAADAPTPRRALAEAIEFALIAGYAALESTPAPETRPARHLAVCTAADEQACPMRRAYRGKFAYSSSELGTGGRRLVAEELDELVSTDPHWIYLNSTSVGANDAEITHLFASPAVV
jgi:hypothetical protein